MTSIADLSKTIYLRNPNIPEQEPVKNENIPIWEMVVKDMIARDGMGRRKYGTPLQAWNGRDPITDAYQEVLDLAVYLRQWIEERELYIDLAQATRLFLAATCATEGMPYLERVDEILKRLP